jgi:hypothetical protein
MNAAVRRWTLRSTFGGGVLSRRGGGALFRPSPPTGRLRRDRNGRRPFYFSLFQKLTSTQQRARFSKCSESYPLYLQNCVPGRPSIHVAPHDSCCGARLPICTPDPPSRRRMGTSILMITNCILGSTPQLDGRARERRTNPQPIGRSSKWPRRLGPFCRPR